MTVAQTIHPSLAQSFSLGAGAGAGVHSTTLPASQVGLVPSQATRVIGTIHHLVVGQPTVLLHCVPLGSDETLVTMASVKQEKVEAHSAGAASRGGFSRVQPPHARGRSGS